jgi:thymidylate kinase
MCRYEKHDFQAKVRQVYTRLEKDAAATAPGLFRSVDGAGSIAEVQASARPLLNRSNEHFSSVHPRHCRRASTMR